MMLQGEEDGSSESAKYCLGFVFDYSLAHVLLMFKHRGHPDARGWNGIGGRVNPGELSHAAMQREGLEEARFIPEQEWTPVGAINGEDFHVQVFGALSSQVFKIHGSYDGQDPLVVATVAEAITWRTARHVRPLLIAAQEAMRAPGTTEFSLRYGAKHGAP